MTEKKSQELIEKIKKLGSIHTGERLNRGVLLGKRLKSMNDKVLKNLDVIYTAINTDSKMKQIIFWVISYVLVYNHIYIELRERWSMRKYVWETSDEIIMIVANNTKMLRKRLKLSRQKLSEMSGVSYGSLKRFEETGNISLSSLAKIAMALDAAGDIKKIFAEVPYRSIQEVIDERN